MTGARRRACRVEELEGPIALEELLPRAGGGEVVLLDSAAASGGLGRWSFLAASPVSLFRARGGSASAGPPGDLSPVPGGAWDALARWLSEHRSEDRPYLEGMPPWLGGAAGYLGYDLARELESLPALAADDLALPEAELAFFDALLATDHAAGRSFAVANGFGATRTEAEGRAGRRLDELLRRFALTRGGGPRAGATPRDADEVRRRLRTLPLDDGALGARGVAPRVERARYQAMVEEARARILAGDLFEVCTTSRFDVVPPAQGVALYRALRDVSGGPFSAYLRFPDVEILSSSPERFLRLDRSGVAETRPIKGTRPRGATVEEDVRLREELSACEKDAAENMMIVDLARNDLGRACAIGSVTVPELRVVESYEFVHQLVSTVRGRLRDGLTPLDLVRCAFPGGSMTGAPKIEAMRLIERLEPVRRGIYAGALGYFDLDGALDLSIVIRTLVVAGGRASFHAGGAVVADSDPEAEYREMLDKTRGVLAALELAAARAAGPSPGAAS